MFCSARQQAYVAACCNEVESHFKNELHVVDVPSQCSRGLARGPDSPGCVLDCCLDFRIFWIAEMTEIRCQVAGPDEDSIDTFDGGDRLEFRKSGLCFQLHQHAYIKVCVLMVALDTPVVVG